ncbi:HAD superfamily phosphatase [Halalkalibacter wakoensis JCM 9140]|uniref:HAD superfamily phosphatase n=1 Tax=Halalkalibacter wakoensis JCM 9140 TaxID=1236970 RepID=W4PZI6_9BACI|nr:HAD hydrolase family protein [Halalkalibacter wakoensis]GAE25152.1 HAD superfamily phosphatase [Halalkalibacter wakoensis JCM 9140]
MKYFKPDFELNHFSDITSDWLQKQNIKTIFSDLDSTLASHDRQAGDDLKQWIAMLKQNNVKLIIASNNSQSRVDLFCEPNGIIGFGKCKKPAASEINKHVSEVGATKDTSLF